MPIGRTSFLRGFTLVELVLVIAILALIAGFAISRIDGLLPRAKVTAAEHDLATIRAAIVAADGGYVADMSGLPGFSRSYLRVSNLLVATNLYGAVLDGTDRARGVRLDDRDAADRFGRIAVGAAPWDRFVSWDEHARRGWRGPYVKSSSAMIGSFPKDDGSGFYPDVSGLCLPLDYMANPGEVSVYGFCGEAALMDPWGKPYVLQIPPAQAFDDLATNVADTVIFQYARVVSAGPNGYLETPCYAINQTNDWRGASAMWRNKEFRRMIRQAGRIGEDVALRGDDLVLFLLRNDVDEGDELP